MTTRPPGKVQVAAWLAKDEVELINNWRRAQKRMPPMSVALRTLALRALKQLENTS